MATITSDLIKASNATVAPVGGGMICRYAKVSVGATLAVNDIIQLIPVEQGDIVHDVKMKVSDLDSGAGIVIDLGDGTDEGRFINGSTVGQAGGVDELDAGVVPYQYSANDTIDAKVVTGAAGAQAGTIEVWAYVTGKM